jgi:hypothetical protein
VSSALLMSILEEKIVELYNDICKIFLRLGRMLTYVIL